VPPSVNVASLPPLSLSEQDPVAHVLLSSPVVLLLHAKASALALMMVGTMSQRRVSIMTMLQAQVKATLLHRR
jgi:hypothetical protein